MKFTSQVIIAFLLLSLTSCFKGNEKRELQQGDLLFQNLDCGELCDAIEAVTEGVNGMDFSHCAMVVRVDDSLRVVEAIGEGVQINSLEDFYARSGSSPEKVLARRVSREYDSLVEEATVFALQQVGAAYDEPFLLNNGKWYCSELIFESFSQANGGNDFFELVPMTFKDPKTNDFFPAWIDYYTELELDIPEGEPGLNPGSISRSDKIKIIDIDLFP